MGHAKEGGDPGLRRDDGRKWLALPLLGLLWCYKYFLSPLLPMACRFTPSCSDYARESILRHGPFKGSWLALRRLGRCHPFGGHGHDPVP